MDMTRGRVRTPDIHDNRGNNIVIQKTENKKNNSSLESCDDDDERRCPRHKNKNEECRVEVEEDPSCLPSTVLSPAFSKKIERIEKEKGGDHDDCRDYSTDKKDDIPETVRQPKRSQGMCDKNTDQERDVEGISASSSSRDDEEHLPKEGEESSPSKRYKEVEKGGEETEPSSRTRSRTLLPAYITSSITRMTRRASPSVTTTLSSCREEHDNCNKKVTKTFMTEGSSSTTNSLSQVDSSSAFTTQASVLSSKQALVPCVSTVGIVDIGIECQK
jgi:hypothetical protein